MSKERETVNSPLNEVIPMDTLEKVADVQAMRVVFCSPVL